MGEPHSNEIYKGVEKLVLPILESNAKRFARQLSMTHPEAFQEARYGLMLALRKYDYNDSRGGIFNFAKTAVRRHFLKLWAAQKAQARRPHVYVISDDGKRTVRPVPFLQPTAGESDFMDTFESVPSSPDATLLETDANAMTSEFQVALESVLSVRDREVLRCKCNPPRGLKMLMLDEMASEPTIPLIGRYLHLSKNEVDWAIRRIREAAMELMRNGDFSDLNDLSIVRAYVERRP